MMSDQTVFNSQDIELFEKTDELIDIFVRAFKDLDVRISNVGRMREAINLAFMEMIRRGCLKDYTASRKEKMGGILKSLVDENSSEDLRRITESAIEQSKKQNNSVVVDSKKSKFFVEKS